MCGKTALESWISVAGAAAFAGATAAPLLVFR